MIEVSLARFLIGLKENYWLKSNLKNLIFVKGI